MLALGEDTFKGKSVLQFSQDPALPSQWPKKLEVSIFGGANSLDLQAIDRPSGSYDIVVCNHVLEHVERDEDAIKELYRVVTEDGFVFLSFPDPIRISKTVDWGFPKEEQHGHFRLYGVDVYEKLKSFLPTSHIFAAETLDPCTGTRESFLLIGHRPQLLTELANRLTGVRWI